MGSHESMKVPIWIVIEMQQKDRQDPQILIRDSFLRLLLLVVCYTLNVFDIRYQQNFTTSQPIKREFKFDGVISNDIIGFALVLGNNLVSVSSDGQRHFDWMSVIFFFHDANIFFFANYVVLNKAAL